MNKQHNFSRRDLLRGFRQPIKETASKTVERSVARPPKAVDESVFARLCNQCGDCEKACPEGIITMQNGLPSVDVDYSACTFCNECSNVCPTLALSGQVNDIGLRAKISSGCINNYSYCDSCQHSCPQQALTWLESDKPSINTALCNGCGLCKSDCFIEAIQFVNVANL